MESTTTLLLAAILLVLLPLLVSPNTIAPPSLLRWLQRKRYQYEVTFGLYMMTPTEKFILNSFLFLTLSLVLIAISLYLPEHIVTISHRAFYYYSGRGTPPSKSSALAAAASAAASTAAQVAASSLDAVGSGVGVVESLVGSSSAVAGI